MAGIGLLKPTLYGWKDSNLAEFCLEHREQKKNSSVKESSWQNAGHALGLQIWRIVNFKVTDWPKENYGKFYSGDSYIILNTFERIEDRSKVSYNVHCWIGAYSTPMNPIIKARGDYYLINPSVKDEYVTAAFKTAELGAYLNENPTQYREVEGHESDLFLSYFPEGIQLKVGGAKSGLRQTRRRDSGEISKSPENTENDSLDSGEEEFEMPLNSATVVDMETHLYRVKEDSESTTFNLVKTGRVRPSDLDKNDVFIIETGRTCFVWIGEMSSVDEKYNGIIYAHNHLMSTDNPLRTIVVIREGQTNKEFAQLFIE